MRKIRWIVICHLALVPAMVGALVVVLLAYRAVLPMAARYVTERRERLVEVLG